MAVLRLVYQYPRLRPRLYIFWIYAGLQNVFPSPSTPGPAATVHNAMARDLVFAAYYLHKHCVQASPILTIDESTSSSCDNILHCRTKWDIIRSCLATIFSCTWVAIHPNIPGPRDGWFTIALRRLALMVLAIIAPEAIILWATRQWLNAHAVAGEHRGAFVFSYPLYFR